MVRSWIITGRERHDGTEQALQILWVAKTLYSDKFADLDMAKESRAFYKTYSNYQLTDAETESILLSTKALPL